MTDALFDTTPYTTTPVADDYDTWLAAVWPAFEEAAATLKPFTAYEVTQAHGLPEPPDPAHHWGQLFRHLKEQGVIREYGWAASRRRTSHGSGVRIWIGVPRTELDAA